MRLLVCAYVFIPDRALVFSEINVGLASANIDKVVDHHATTAYDVLKCYIAQYKSGTCTQMRAADIRMLSDIWFRRASDIWPMKGARDGIDTIRA